MKIKIGLRWREYVWGIGILCERSWSVKPNDDYVYKNVELTMMFGWLEMNIFFERKTNE